MYIHIYSDTCMYKFMYMYICIYVHAYQAIALMASREYSLDDLSDLAVHASNHSVAEQVYDHESCHIESHYACRCVMSHIS